MQNGICTERQNATQNIKICQNLFPSVRRPIPVECSAGRTVDHCWKSPTGRQVDTSIFQLLLEVVGSGAFTDFLPRNRHCCGCDHNSTYYRSLVSFSIIVIFFVIFRYFWIILFTPRWCGGLWRCCHANSIVRVDWGTHSLYDSLIRFSGELMTCQFHQLASQLKEPSATLPAGGCCKSDIGVLDKYLCFSKKMLCREFLNWINHNSLNLSKL